jgi:putative flippase GtrA
MEDPAASARAPRRLLLKFSVTALAGFAVSAVVLHLGLQAGLRPWTARLVALACAMNLTFVINGRFVFRTLTRRTFAPQWCAYAANSAVGNFCNYSVFVALESTHRPVIGNPYVALLAGSITAWAINFTGARLLVFGHAGRRFLARCAERFVSRPRPVRLDPEPAERESSRR